MNDFTVVLHYLLHSFSIAQFWMLYLLCMYQLDECNKYTQSPWIPSCVNDFGGFAAHAVTRKMSRKRSSGTDVLKVVSKTLKSMVKFVIFLVYRTADTKRVCTSTLGCVSHQSVSHGGWVRVAYGATQTRKCRINSHFKLHIDGDLLRFCEKQTLCFI